MGEQNSAYRLHQPAALGDGPSTRPLVRARTIAALFPASQDLNHLERSRTVNRFIRPLALVFAAACSSSVSPTTTPPAPDVSRPRPEPPQAVEFDVVRFMPGSGAYEIASQSTVTQEFMGQRQEQALTTTMFLAATVTHLGDEFRATLAIDSIVVPDSAPTVPGLDVAELYRGVVGLELTAILDRGGRLLELTGGDSTSEVAQQVVNSLRSFYPTLPASGAMIGTRWADTTAENSAMRGIELAVTTFADHEATAWTEVSGRLALEVMTDARSELTGRGTQGGQELDLQGSGVRAARSYFSMDGDYLGGTANDSTNIAVLVVASGMVVPVVQVASIVVRRLPAQ